MIFNFVFESNIAAMTDMNKHFWRYILFAAKMFFCSHLTFQIEIWYVFAGLLNLVTDFAVLYMKMIAHFEKLILNFIYGSC